MKPEEINRAIAELCGWKWTNHPDVLERTKTFTLKDKWVLNPDGELVFPHSVTNYYHDLNACAEFERTVITPNDMGAYLVKLERSISGAGIRSAPGQFAMTTATAPQRCEAFLRLHGKWREG